MSLPNRQIVIDDSDSQVRFIGSGWVMDSSGSQDGFGTYGATYEHTLHATKANDSLAFSFQGSSIQVFGTVDLSPTYGTALASPDFTPPWECFIDNTSIGSSTPSPFHENNWLLCEVDHLSDGQHELTLNVSMRQGTTFRVDYLQYTPSGNLSDSENAVVLVENTDPALSYDSDWREVDGVAHMTTTQGSQVTLNFTGTQLTWIGYIPIEQPGNGSSASYSIDNGSPTSFALVGHPPTDGTSRFNQIFFTTPRLAPGPHTMVVEYNGNPQLTPLTLEHIYLTTSSSGGNPTATMQPGGGKHTSVGPVVGGVVGGIAAIAIILGLVFFWRRRQRRSISTAFSSNAASTWLAGQPASHIPRENQNEAVSPFTLTRLPPSELSSAALVSSTSLSRSHNCSQFDGTHENTSMNQSSNSGYISGAMAQIGDTKRGVSGDGTRDRPTQLTVNALPQPGVGQVYQHIQRGAVVLEEIPPQYSA
ncbi:hypothetical protein FPV67DRAFT_110212 [Lyophyllum atratum]|nr:hypothetical protein FPV67DRAFT_110212 [Lyophyllum atratum]